MGKNVLIPLALVNQIIDLLRYWDISKLDRALRDDYGDIMHSLQVKLQKLELRDAYTKIITARNEDSRDDARMDYLWHRRRLRDMSTDDFSV